jgi:hypothetical protein
MKNTRDELMEEFSRILTATDGKPRPMTEEEYRDLERGIYSTHGEGAEWHPEGMKAPVEPEPIKEEPGPVEVEEEVESPPGWPKKVKHQDGTEAVYRTPEEWREAARKKYDLPEPKPSEPEYSDEEVMKMIQKDPSDVVTNLMLHRKPEYRKFMYPMLKAFVDWMTETGVHPERGTMLYEETIYMLDELERQADLEDAEKGIEKTKTELDELEKAVEEEEKRRAPPAIQSGETEWKS